MSPRKSVLHLTWDNPLPLYPGPLTTQPHPNSSSLPPPPCQLYTPLLLLLLLLLKAVQLPWVILTWWIIKTSETLVPSGNSRLLVEEEKRVGRWSDTLLKLAWGGTLWAGLWATAIHPSIHPFLAHICFHRPKNSSLGSRSQHGRHFFFFSWSTWHSGEVVAAQIIVLKVV